MRTVYRVRIRPGEKRVPWVDYMDTLFIDGAEYDAEAGGEHTGSFKLRAPHGSYPLWYVNKEDIDVLSSYVEFGPDAQIVSSVLTAERLLPTHD